MRNWALVLVVAALALAGCYCDPCSCGCASPYDDPMGTAWNGGGCVVAPPPAPVAAPDAVGAPAN